MANRKTYTAFASLMTGVVTASLILFPSVLGIIAKPVEAIWLMWLYFASGLAGFVFLAYTFYIATYTSAALPVRTSGLGAIASVVCILSFVIFLFWNLLADQQSKPVVLSVTSSAYVANPGGILTLAARGEDQDGDRLKWTWTVQSPVSKAVKGQPKPTAISGRLETTVWRIPETAAVGFHTVSVVASDRHRSSVPETIQIEIRKEK